MEKKYGTGMGRGLEDLVGEEGILRKLREFFDRMGKRKLNEETKKDHEQH